LEDITTILAQRFTPFERYARNRHLAATFIQAGLKSCYDSRHYFLL